MQYENSKITAECICLHSILHFTPPTPTDAILKLECAEIENKIHIYSVQYKLNLN